MQRPIKFRAWVEASDMFRKSKEGKMYIGFSFDSVESGREEANVYCDNGDTWEEPNWGRAKLMQYTGLKDKNGVEIYEGDIVSANYYAFTEGKSSKIKGEIIYDTEQFIGYRIDNTRMSACSNFEVIGNIYEHGHLLEEPTHE